MANKLYEESTVQQLADNIRLLTGSEDTYTLAEMAAAVVGYQGSFDPIATSTDETGAIYNNGLGYKIDTRINSSGQEVVANGYACTGYIPRASEDTIFIASALLPVTYLNVYNNNREHIGSITLRSSVGHATAANVEVSAANASWFRLTFENVDVDTKIQSVRVRVGQTASTPPAVNVRRYICDNPTDVIGSGTYFLAVSGDATLARVRDLDSLIVICTMSGTSSAYGSLKSISTANNRANLPYIPTDAWQLRRSQNLDGEYSDSFPVAKINGDMVAGAVNITKDGDFRIVPTASAYCVPAGRIDITVIW